MKKKILSGVFALAILAIVGLGVNKSMSNKTQLSDLALANVEALANGEGGGDETNAKRCWSKFVGGIAWPRQCPSCIMLPFSTGVGDIGKCFIK